MGVEVLAACAVHQGVMKGKDDVLYTVVLILSLRRDDNDSPRRTSLDLPPELITAPSMNPRHSSLIPLPTLHGLKLDMIPQVHAWDVRPFRRRSLLSVDPDAEHRVVMDELGKGLEDGMCRG